MLTPQDYQKLLDGSMEELRLKTEAHQVSWGLGKFERWDMNLDVGDLVFSNPDGVIATCPAQVIGSLDSASGTWLWAWANPSIPENLTRDSLVVQDFGRQNGIDRLTTNVWYATSDDAWQMTALAVRLCQSQGAYRGPAGSTFVFITFSRVTLSKR